MIWPFSLLFKPKKLTPESQVQHLFGMDLSDWHYLGYCIATGYSITNQLSTMSNAGYVHFFVDKKDFNKRCVKIFYSDKHSRYQTQPWYNAKIAPWAAGTTSIYMYVTCPSKWFRDYSQETHNVKWDAIKCNWVDLDTKPAPLINKTIKTTVIQNQDNIIKIDFSNK